jgi:cytochrome P450
MNRHLIPMGSAVSFVDPPDHTRIRSVVAHHFTDARTRRRQPRVEGLVKQLLDGMAAAEPPVDVIETVISPLPLALVGEIFGIEPADLPHIRRWAQGILVRPRDDNEVAHARMLRDEAADFFRHLLDARRATPVDDLMSDLARAVSDGRMDEDEALAMASLTALNGWHPMRNSLANMVFTVLTHPNLAHALLDGGTDAAERVVEELLRWIPHKNGIGQPRIATEDVTLGNVTIRAGEYVYVQYWAANRDPKVFGRPDDLDPHRAGPAHLAFGHGPHYCVAPALARLQATILLPALLSRFPSLRLAKTQADVTFHTDALIRGPVTLPVTWSAS